MEASRGVRTLPPPLVPPRCSVTGSACGISLAERLPAVWLTPLTTRLRGRAARGSHRAVPAPAAQLGRPESIPISGQAAPRAWSQVAGSSSSLGSARRPVVASLGHERDPTAGLSRRPLPGRRSRACLLPRHPRPAPDEHAEYECWAGETCLEIWMPEQLGMTFVAQKGNPLPLGVEDVGAARAALEARA